MTEEITTVHLTDAQREAVNMAARLVTAVDRADQLGWDKISVDRLLRVAHGDTKALPPDPATAPPSAFGSRRRRRPAVQEE